MKITSISLILSPDYISFMGGVADTSFGRWEIIYLQISNAAWTSSLGKAVVIRILFSRYPLAKKFISFPPVSMYAQGS